MPTLASDHRRSLPSPPLTLSLGVDRMWCLLCTHRHSTHHTHYTLQPGAFLGLFWQMFAIWQQQQQQSLHVFSNLRCRSSHSCSGMLGFGFGCGFVYSSPACLPGKTYISIYLYLARYQLNISFGFSHFPHDQRRWWWRHLLSQLKVICLSCFMSKLMEIHHNNNRDVVKGEASTSCGLRSKYLFHLIEL